MSFRITGSQVTSNAEEVEQLSEEPVKDTKKEVTNADEPCSDPQIYGMNIGLHYILEDINKRLSYGDRVHLESLIKVNIQERNIFITISPKVFIQFTSVLFPHFFLSIFIHGCFIHGSKRKFLTHAFRNRDFDGFLHLRPRESKNQTFRGSCMCARMSACVCMHL